MKKIQKLSKTLLIHGITAYAVDDSINGMWLGKSLVVAFDIDHTKQEGSEELQMFTTQEHCALCFADFVKLGLGDCIDYYRGESDEFKELLAAVYSAQSVPSFRDCKIGANTQTQSFCLRLAFAIKNDENGNRLSTEFDCWCRLCQLGGLGNQVAKIMESINA